MCRAMNVVSMNVRSPTGTAWLTTLGAFMATGETYYEMAKPGPSTFFGLTIGDAIVLPVVIVLALLTLASACWLISLYAAPGRIAIDIDAGTLSRALRPFFRLRVVIAPLSAWSVHLVYYNEADRARRVFKRLELRGPQHNEVLLFADFKRGEELAAGFERIHRALANYNAEITT